MTGRPSPPHCAAAPCSWRGTARTLAPRERLQAGSRWRFPLRLRAPRGLRNPGGGDAEKFALAARLAATGFVLEPTLAVRLAAPSGIDAWREAMSARIAATVPSGSSRYVRALALGDTRAMDDADWARLRAAGLTHLIAISGFHVGLVAGFCALCAAALWWMWPPLGRWLPRPFAAGAGALLGAFGYALLTGMAVPTLRTAVMIAALVAARWLRRRLRLIDTLALGCCVLLLLDPLAVLGAGFWLSFAGVAWLLWCLPDGAGKGPRAIAGGFVAAQAVASLGLLPLTVLLFGQASFAGPFANLAAVPWWSLVVVPLALLGVLADTLHAGSGQWCWQAAAWCFDLLWPLLARIADSPLAMAWLPAPRWYALPLALLSAFWLLLPRGLPGRGLALLLWLPLLYPPRELPAPGEVELTVIDVGQGLSVLVRTAHHSLLYDMGPAIPDGFDAGERAVIPALHALGVRRLDLAVVSHGDNDHAGGLRAVARRSPCRWCWRHAAVRWPAIATAGQARAGNGTACASTSCIPAGTFPISATRRPACCASRAPMAAHCWPATSATTSSGSCWPRPARNCAATWCWCRTTAATARPIPASWRLPGRNWRWCRRVPTTASAIRARRWCGAGAGPARRCWTVRARARSGSGWAATACACGNSAVSSGGRGTQCAGAGKRLGYATRRSFRGHDGRKDDACWNSSRPVAGR